MRNFNPISARSAAFTRALCVIAVGFAVFGISQGARAGVVYSYAGNLFTSVLDDPGVPGAFDSSMSVNGFFEVAAPLGANTPLTDISGLVVDYEFTDGQNTLDSSNSFFGELLVSTDGAGILDWTVTLFQNGHFDLVANELSARIITRTVAGGSPNAFDQGFTFLCLSPTCFGVGSSTGVSDRAVVSPNPGSWSVQTVTAVSEPGTLAIVAAGLVVLGLARRKRTA